MQKLKIVAELKTQQVVPSFLRELAATILTSGLRRKLVHLLSFLASPRNDFFSGSKVETFFTAKN